MTQDGGSAETISIGETKSGTLSTSDCVGDDYSYYADLYTFSAAAGQQIAILMQSTAFDTFLRLYDPSGLLLISDDNGGGGTNSRIPPTSGYYTLPSTGIYTIKASSSNSGFTHTGVYTLILSGPTISFVTDKNSVTVPEGGTATFQVKLSSQPSSTVIATAARVSGDSDITLLVRGIAHLYHLELEHLPDRNARCCRGQRLGERHCHHPDQRLRDREQERDCH